MLLDVRTYTCRPGTMKMHLDLYAKEGKGPQTRHLGQPFAFLVPETGDVNHFVHIWLYEDTEDRDRRRTALWADAEWLAWVDKSTALGVLVSQENQFMRPVAFFPIER